MIFKCPLRGYPKILYIKECGQESVCKEASRERGGCMPFQKQNPAEEEQMIMCLTSSSIFVLQIS